GGDGGGADRDDHDLVGGAVTETESVTGSGMPAGASTLEGVRPRNAVCMHCGYHFGGIEIRSGTITCPECGKETEFVLRKPEVRTGRLVRWLNVVGWAGAATITVLVWSQSGTKAGLIVLGTVVVFWVV